MDSFAISSLVIIGIWVLVILKLTYDQAVLFKMYKAKVDHKFLLYPVEELSKGRSLIKIYSGRLRILFAEYPEHPKLNRLAKKVRYEFIAILGLMVIVVVFFFSQG